MKSRAEIEEIDRQLRQLDDAKPRTPSSSEAYRDGWERIWGMRRFIEEVTELEKKRLTDEALNRFLWEQR